MDRERLTITLRDDLLRRVDGIVDGLKIRNRSHAIEYLLSQLLAPKVSQAVILAGGRGVKMRPLTYEIPKPLVSVKGRPLIEYALDLLRGAGIKEVIVAIGHLGEKIREELGSGKKYGIKLYYSQEEKPLGTGGALLHAREFLNKKPFIVINGDILVKIDLLEFVNFHGEEKYLATMALSTVSDTKGYGTVLLRGEKIIDFLSTEKRAGSQLVNAGIYIFNPEIFDYIPQKGKVNLDDIFPRLARKGKLAGFSFEGPWFEISTPRNYERAIKEWEK